MATFSRSGLFGFLLLLAALAPAGAGASSLTAAGATTLAGEEPQPAAFASPLETAPGSIDARLRRISQALREKAPEQLGPEDPATSPDGRLAFVFANGGGRGVGWGNGGFRNGGFGNGGFRNGGWGNGGFRNGGFGNGGFRNGGFRNFW